MSNELIDILNEAARLLFLGLLPLVVIVCLGSIFGTVLQASLAVEDPTFSFGVRLLALLFGLYFFLPSIIASLIELGVAAYGT